MQICITFEGNLLYFMTFPNFTGVCYSYDMTRNGYTTNTNTDNFQWDWTSSKVKFYRNGITQIFVQPTKSNPTPRNQDWELTGFMGANVLFNEDGVVFSTPLARSFPIGYGGDSGTIILKKGNDEFIIADGKWRKDNTDFLQNLVGTAIAKGNFYGSTESG